MQNHELVFEAVTLATVSFASALLMLVSQRTIQSYDALRIYMLIGSFLSTLLGFYVPYEHSAKYWIAVVSVPLSSRLFNWLFSSHPGDGAAAGFSASKQHNP